MKIDWHLKNFEFSGPYESSREYFEEKLSKIWSHAGHLLDTESSVFKVDVSREDTKSHEEKYFVKVVLTLPGKPSLESDIRGITPNECIDKIEDKLFAQIEHIKDR